MDLFPPLLHLWIEKVHRDLRESPQPLNRCYNIREGIVGLIQSIPNIIVREAYLIYSASRNANLRSSIFGRFKFEPCNNIVKNMWFLEYNTTHTNLV